MANSPEFHSQSTMDIERKSINVKWNGKPIENVRVSEGQHVFELKRTLEESCGVPVKKQKLLFKGKILKDEDLIDEKMFENSQTIILMGAAGITDISTHLSNASANINPEPQTEADGVSMFLGTGLKNLGNTCYVNSSLQVLFGLNQEINLFGGKENSTDNIEPLYDSLLSTMKMLKKGEDSISPLDFILKLRNKLPIYAEKDKYGIYIQHDVHEFWSTLIAHIGSNDSNITKAANIILEKKAADKPVIYENVTYVFLPVTSETNSLQDSLSKAFSEKSSESNDIISTSSFSNVPEFLSFVFMRFMWKTNEKVQAKILKLVSYPKTFDIMNYASDDLKTEIIRKRASIPSYGLYDLHFLITHTGREADSGHYMAWGKALKSAKSDKWFKYDDDKVSVVKEEEIMKLGGGGDRPTAYMIFYLPTWSEVDNSVPKDETGKSAE